LHDRELMRYVLHELLEYEDATQHFGTVIVNKCTITVEIYTDTINDVTDADREYAAYIYDIVLDAIEMYNVRQNASANCIWQR